MVNSYAKRVDFAITEGSAIAKMQKLENMKGRLKSRSSIGVVDLNLLKFNSAQDHVHRFSLFGNNSPASKK
jgi:hypothetical protein